MGIINRYITSALIAISLAVPAVMNAIPSDSLYRVGLVMPFKSSGAKGGLTDASLDFYEGVKIAMEDLEALGLKVRLYVYDSQRDSFGLDDMLQHPDIAKLDLMIGPVVPQELDKVARFCGKHQIPLVSPLRFYQAPAGSGCIVINPFSNDSTRIKGVTEKALWNFPGRKVFVINDNTTESNRNIAYIKSVFNGYSRRSLHVVNYKENNLISQLPLFDSVVIVVPTSKTAALEMLIKYLETNPNAIVVGHHTWLEKLEPTMNTMNLDRVFLPEMSFVDSRNPEVFRFRSRYRTAYFTEPSRFNYMGYDQMMFFGQAMMTFGKSFTNRVLGGSFPGLQNEYAYKKRHGYIENYGINYVVVREMQPIRHLP